MPNLNAVYTTLGASNHVPEERQNEDYYATHPIAAELLLEVESFDSIWEPSCGEGHLAKVFKESGVEVYATDLIDRGYGEGVFDFLDCEHKWPGDIVTNPPYNLAREFIEHSLGMVEKGAKVAMFLKVQFLEGQARRSFFAKYPPRTVYVSSKRIPCAKNGDFESMKSSAVAYAWFVWEKGYQGSPAIEWIN